MKHNEYIPCYVVEDMYNYIKSFLEAYPVSKLLEILADVVDTIERKEAKDD